MSFTPTGSTCSVLIASGERDQRKLDWTILSRRGYDLLHASSADEAVRLYLQNPEVAVVIVDLETLETDGLALVEELRAAGREWTEYLAIAGEDRIPAIARAVKLQLSDFLLKPAGGEQLLTAVTEAHNVSRMRQFRRDESRALELSIAEFKQRTSAAATQLIARARGLQDAEPTAAPEIPSDPSLLAFITEEYARAQARERVFGPLAQHHATWLLLLVLSDALMTGTEPTIKSAAYAAGLPLSSALRKINEMCADGLIVRRGDPEDARRSFISLTPRGQNYFARYLGELSRGPRKLAQQA